MASSLNKYQSKIRSVTVSISIASSLNKYQSKISSVTVTDINLFLLVEKIIRVGMCHVIHQYVKPNGTMIKDYDDKRIVIS